MGLALSFSQLYTDRQTHWSSPKWGSALTRRSASLAGKKKNSCRSRPLIDAINDGRKSVVSREGEKVKEDGKDTVAELAGDMVVPVVVSKRKHELVNLASFFVKQLSGDDNRGN
jgi:hypothetical protein